MPRTCLDLQARILTWSVIALNIAFVGLAVALFAIHNQDSVLASEVREGLQQLMHCPGMRPYRAPVACGLSSRQTAAAALQVRNMYWGRLVIAAVCLGALLFTAAWFFFAFRRSQKEGRVW